MPTLGPRSQIPLGVTLGTPTRVVAKSTGTAVTVSTAGYKSLLWIQSISTGTAVLLVASSHTSTKGIQLSSGATLIFDGPVPHNAIYSRTLTTTTGKTHTLIVMKAT